MLLAVERADVVELPVAVRHEVGIKQLLQELVDRLKPTYPRATASLFLKADGCVLYTVDAHGTHHGKTARSYHEARQAVDEALVRRPLTVAQIEQTLGVSSSMR